MNKVSLTLLVTLALLLGLIHSQSYTIEEILELTRKQKKPCIECLEGHKQLCLKLIENCKSYTLEGECTLFHDGFSLLDGECKKNITPI